jgi:hypothetical protein
MVVQRGKYKAAPVSKIAAMKLAHGDLFHEGVTASPFCRTFGGPVFSGPEFELLGDQLIAFVATRGRVRVDEQSESRFYNADRQTH